MAKKLSVGCLFVSLAVNVLMLALSLEAYHSLEIDHAKNYMYVALIFTIITGLSYLVWKKNEYSKNG